MNKNIFETIENIISNTKNLCIYEDISLINPNRGIIYHTYLNNINFLKVIGGYLLKKYKNRFYSRDIINNSQYDGLFYSDYIDFRTIYDFKSKKPIFENEFNYNLINFLKEKNPNIKLLEILYYDFIKTNRKQIDPLINQNRIPFEWYISKEILKKEHNFYYDKYNLRKYLNSNIYNYLKYKAFPETVRWYLTWNKIFKIHKPKFFFLISEYGPLEYMGVVASKKHNIPSIALQHGVISETHVGYYHHPKNIAKDRDDFINYVIPDLTLVQGKYEKRILLKYGYPKKSVVVTGQPRYDFLKYADEIFNREKIIKKYNLPKNKRFIIWATQTHGLSKEENIKNIKAIFGAMKKLNDKYHLIIKLHPGENQKAPLYKKFLKGKSFATIIDGKKNTHELLYISDILITKHSTVGIESILMNRPILLTETVKSVDLSLYTNYGFNYKIKNENDFIGYIKMLESGELLDDFKKKRDYFLKDRISNFGNATEKVIDILERFL